MLPFIDVKYFASINRRHYKQLFKIFKTIVVQKNIQNIWNPLPAMVLSLICFGEWIACKFLKCKVLQC